MRLVDVHLDADRPLHVVLHPRLTVVTGDAVACTRLTQVLGRAFALAGTEVVGTIEYSGFPAPLDQTTVVSLDLAGEGLLVVTANDLPPPDHHRHDEAVATVLQRRDAAVGAEAEAARRAGELQRTIQAMEAAATVGRQELEASQGLLGQLQDRIRETEARHIEILAALAAQQEEVIALGEQAAEQTVVYPGVVSSLDPVEGAGRRLRMGDDLTTPRQVVERAQRCGLIQESVASAVLLWLHEVETSKAAADPVVAELRHEVAEMERRWNEVASVGVEDEPEVVQARLRHEELAARLRALQELAASGVLVEQARDEIEAAHAERARLESERGKTRALSEAVANEETVTAKYGFGSFLDYTIALSTRSVGEAVQATLDRVRAEAVGAADALEAVREGAAAIRHQLTEERAVTRARFRGMVGSDAESLSVESLGRIPAIPIELTGLSEQMQAELVSLEGARNAAAAMIGALESQRDAVLVELDELRLALEDRSSVLDALVPLVEQAQVQWSAAVGELGEMSRWSAGAVQEAARCDAELEALSQEDLSSYSSSDVPAVLTHLAPLVDPPAADPVPVVMADALRPLGADSAAALEAMTAAAVRVQIIYVTDDPRVIGWARSLSDTAGSLARLHRPGWIQRRLARRSPSPRGVSSQGR